MSISLPTTYQDVIFLSKYSRWREDLKRRETFEETVDRYINFFHEYIDNWKFERISEQDSFQNKEVQNRRKLLHFKLNIAREAIINLKVVPSMRALKTAGKALESHNASGYNCVYSNVDHPHVFDEILYLSCCGCGNGFSVEQKHISQLPDIPEELHTTDTVIKVADSKIGWATALRELISLLYAGKIPSWDVSKVRPYGSILKTFGGRASGPEPLVSLFEFVIAIFKKAVGRKLTSLEVHDIICKIGLIAESGGTRRAALISLSDIDDPEMRFAKSGNWWDTNSQRSYANNSAVYNQKPELGKFLEEWTALYRSKSGERGICNLYANRKSGNERRDWTKVSGTNPCVIGTTNILTREGYFKIGALVDKNVEIWNGYEWSWVKPFRTGKNSLCEIEFSNGQKLTTTLYHKFILKDGSRIEAKNLAIGDKLMKWNMPVIDSNYYFNQNDGYSQGFYSADGCENNNCSYVYEPKYNCISRLNGTFREEPNNSRICWKHGMGMFDKKWVPINDSITYKLDWLAGLLDGDGTVTRDKNGNGLQISSINYTFLQDVLLMLNTLGVNPKIVFGKNAGYKNIKGKYYFCQGINRLIIGNYDTFKLIQLGLKTNRLILHNNPPQRDARQFVKVLSVKFLNEKQETFCVTEPKNNSVIFEGVMTSNCSEIALRSQQCCNLSEVIVRPDDDENTLLNKVEIATFLGTLQSLLTDFKYLRKIWKKNCDEERLLGVSLTGILDCPYVVHNDTILNKLKKHAIETNKYWAGLLGINQSTAITCVKPSGNTSQLTDAASGIHPRYSPYYIRTIRMDNKDPLTRLMIDQGFPNEPCVSKPNTTTIFSFPLKSPENSIFRNDFNAIQQLELWKKFKENYVEHTISNTIYVKEDEWLEVAAWVYKHFDVISGVSFHPYDGGIYKQAPYQECTKEEYEAFLLKMPTNIDWSKIADYEKEDQTTSSREGSCSGGTCELI